MPDALNLLKHGALSLGSYPYREGQCRRPSDIQRADATDFPIADWRAVDYHSLDQVKGELAKGHPVIISVKDTQALHALKWNQIYHPTDNDGVPGWHALTVVGYNERLQAFKVINSWGTHWADGGFGWIDYDAFSTGDVREAYVMRPIRQVAPTPTPAPAPAPPKPNPRPVAVTPVPIAGLECGHVTEILRNGNLVFTGFVGSDSDLGKLTDQARRANASVEVAVRPWPQCEVLLTLDKALASPDHLSVKIEIAGRVGEKREEAAGATETSNYLKFTLVTPPYPSFLLCSVHSGGWLCCKPCPAGQYDAKSVPAIDKNRFRRAWRARAEIQSGPALWP